ncbi:hypothetical protein FS837_006385 [Tulasnella sp. UAMH 9824]|nr:hypothetical protein FS837_006385 [Tulasnella sp. UAMH 9824]
MFGRRASCDPQPSAATHSNFSLKRRLSLAHVRRPSTAPINAPPLVVSASTFQPIAMPTTTAATFQPPPLPSTTNTLGAKERAELVRRTRKLEQVLGVAMHVVEAGEAPPSASGADGAHSIPDRIEIPDASSSTSNASAHVPRRRLKSLRRPSPSSRPVTAPAPTPTGGVMISTSTQVHVDTPTETTVVVSPPPGESTLPWYCSPVNLDDDEDESSEQQGSVVVRSKQSLVFSSSSQSLLGHDLPTTSTPTTTTSYVFPSPMSSTTHLTVQSTATAGRGRGRDRSSSVTSTATLDSIASTSTFTLPDPRQRQVHQALKLQRRLGETIPPELLTGSQPSPSSNDLASSTDSASSKRRKVTHKPSLSLKMIHKKKPKHQQVQVVVEPAEATRSVPERSQRRRSHRRVHSDDMSVMKLRVVNSEADLPATCRSPSRGTDWTSTVATLPPAWASDIVLPTRASKSMDVDQDSESRHLLAASPTTPMPIRRAARSLEEDDEVRRMTPKEKSLNVRRAQKMTKKFGQAPPHTLFQITTNNPSSTRISINIDLELSSTTSSLRRHSTTYTLSVPRSPAASSTWSFHGDENNVPTPTAESDPSAPVRRRSSLGSFVTSEANMVKMGLGDSSSQPSGVKSIPSPIVVEFPAKDEVGVVSPTATAVTPTTPRAKQGPVSPLKLAQVFEPPTMAPPLMPLSNVNGDSSASNSGASGPARRKRTLSRSKSQSFATKRRQATKLTKFFGVEYPDLYQAMVHTTTTVTTTTHAATASTPSLSTQETREPVEKKTAPHHYQKVSARTRKSSDAALPSRPPPPPPSAYKKRRSVVAGLTSSNDSSSLRVGVDDSCRWSAKGPEEVEELMTKLRAMKA